ncbi:MAG: hypothetical protein J6V25_11145 [Oscillospiraceae bacterium]|nr:hypothetical protein [Oscillospiraceae bacterium]
MFELLMLILFVWLFVKAVGLAFKVTWGLAKVVAVILFVLALPALLGCFLVAGGIALLIPVLLVGAAVGILKNCM